MDKRQAMQSLRTPIVLAVSVLLLAGGVWWGYHLVVTGQRPIQPDPCVTVSLTELRPENVVVRVYNGGSMRGLAGEKAKALKAAGFIIAATGNTEEPIHDTVIVGAAEDNPEVQFVAAWFEKVTIRSDGRPDHSVDVLVGDAGALMTPEPPLSLAIPSGQVCVPPSASPTPEVDPAGDVPAEELPA